MGTAVAAVERLAGPGGTGPARRPVPGKIIAGRCGAADPVRAARRPSAATTRTTRGRRPGTADGRTPSSSGAARAGRTVTGPGPGAVDVTGGGPGPARTVPGATTEQIRAATGPRPTLPGQARPAAEGKSA